VWDYIRRFSQFTDYRHRVLTIHQGKVYAMPINLSTICAFYGRYLTPTEARALIANDIAATGVANPTCLEEKAVSLIGRNLYEAFIRGYTRKQWQVDPRLLPPEIITRLPVRFNFNDRYFNDSYEGLPINGYSDVFQKMLNHSRIQVYTGVDFFDVRPAVHEKQLLIFTGAIDRFFDYRVGSLGWRTLDFEREVVPLDDFQGTSVMNYADEDIPFTRIHEFKHLHPERRYPPGHSLIYREYSRTCGRDDEPYYPINTAHDARIYEAYRGMAKQQPRVLFGGRLGTYRYVDMHQAIGASLKAFDNRVRPFFAADGVWQDDVMAAE
jgi:UDP-galactopyranose mutase